MGMIRLMVQIPAAMKECLDALRGEGYTAAGYIRHLLQMDMQARKEQGWTPKMGWPKHGIGHPVDPTQ